MLLIHIQSVVQKNICLQLPWVNLLFLCFLHSILCFLSLLCTRFSICGTTKRIFIGTLGHLKKWSSVHWNPHSSSRVEGLTGVWVGMNYPLGNFKYLAKFPFFSPFIVSLKSYNACKIICAVGSLMNPLHFLSRGSKSCSDRDSWHPDDSLPWSSTKRHNWLSPLQTDWSLRHKGSRCWEH